MKVPLQVLVLEDRKSDAELQIKELEKAGFSVDWERVDTMRDFRARLTPKLNLILSDYQLAGFTFVEAMGALKASGLDVPLILVSGTVGEERGVECVKLGATDCILKDRLVRLGPAVHRALFDHEQRMKLERQTELVAKSEEQLRGILSNLDAVVWSMSLDAQKLYYISPAIENFTGRPPQDFLANANLLMQQVHPEDVAGVTASFDRVARWGAAEYGFRLVRSDGKVRDVVLRAWAAYDKERKPERMDGICTDVTDKLEAERERNQAEIERREAERVKQLSEFKSHFLDMLAHDLNNVLTPLSINAKLVGDELVQAGRGESKPMDGLRHSLKRMNFFLADVLDSSRLQASKLVITSKPFDLAASLRQTLDTLAQQAHEASINLDVHLPNETLVKADPHRMEQVTTNLLSNAFKFTPAGGTVTVALTQKPGAVEFMVKDTGIGISPDDAAKLFQPFTKLGTTPQGKHTGTGLGLFISRGIVEGHGGTISCHSDGLGKGTTFAISLPSNGLAEGSDGKHGGETTG